MPSFFDATVPFAPFSEPVPVPAPLPFDAPLVCFQVNETWMTYLMGCAQALLAASTWDTDDPGILHAVLSDARQVIAAMMSLEACPVPIQFRVSPTYSQNWQYSLDGGGSWLDGPDTATNFTPAFSSSPAPSGWKVSVNGNHTATDFPLVTAATANDAVITDPASDLRNLITAGVGGAEGLVIQALAQVGVRMVQSNGIALALNKIPLFGLATSVLETLAGGTDYTYDLLNVVLP